MDFKKYTLIFVSSYLLTAIGFLCFCVSKLNNSLRKKLLLAFFKPFIVDLCINDMATKLKTVFTNLKI